MTKPTQRLRALLNAGRTVWAAGAYDALSARMASPPLPEKARLRPLQRRLAEYTALQRDAARLIASAVESNSQGQADQATELMAKARALESELTRELDALRAPATGVQR